MKQLNLLVLVGVMTAIAIAIGQKNPDPIVSNVTPPISAQTTPQLTDCRTIRHTGGETEVCGQPKRIVVLGPYALEPLVALKIQPIGYADHFAFRQATYTNPGQQIPYLGSRLLHPLPLANVGTASMPSFEAILKLKPDLILGTDGSNSDQYQALSKIAPTLLLDWRNGAIALTTVAQAMQRSEPAAQLITAMNQRIALAHKAFSPVVTTHPKLLLLAVAQWPELYLGDSRYGLCYSLLKELGFQLVELPKAKSQSGIPTLISLEILSELNTANSVVVLGANYGSLNDDNDFEQHQLNHIKYAWKKSAIAQSLNASKAGRVYFIPGYLCRGFPGPIGTELYLNELKKQLLSPS